MEPSEAPRRTQLAGLRAAGRASRYVRALCEQLIGAAQNYSELLLGVGLGWRRAAQGLV